MINIDFIRNILKRYVDQGIRKFIIYPYGINGLITKIALKEYFNLEPYCIIDNGYSKYNEKIANKNAIRNEYEKDAYLIITIENEETNTQILNELLEFVPASNIINLSASMKLKEVNNQNQVKKYGSEGFCLSDFLPSCMHKESSCNNEKIKVRIVHCGLNFWNAIESICRSFRDDEQIDFMVIIGAGRGKNELTEQVQGYNYISIDKYRVKNDKPDVLILTSPFENSLQLECRKNIRLIIAIYLPLVRYITGAKTTDDFFKMIQMGFERYQPDYYFYDSLLYREIKQTKYFSNKIREMGNAKFDGIYDALKDKEYGDGWEKLKGKRTVLWITSHGIEDKKVYANITFDLYAKTIFEYAENHLEMGFIFRPHRYFIKEMLESGFWTYDDYETVREYFKKSPNMVFDETPGYDNSISIADGILTEAVCGVVCSALPTLKPICATFRTRRDLTAHEELLTNLYLAYEEKDVINYLDMIRNGTDPKFNVRKKAGSKFVKSFDGKNGLRIKEFIKAVLLEE